MKRALVLCWLLSGCDTPSSSSNDLRRPPGDGGVADLAASPPPAVRSCATTFRYTPERQVGLVAVAGEWNGFDPAKGEMSGPDPQGAWSVAIKLPIGAHGYKLVLGSDPNRTWILDPASPLTKVIGGVENSVVEVDDCKLPLLRFGALQKTSDGTLHAEAFVTDGSEAAGLDPARITARLDGQSTPASWDSARRLITVDAKGLARDKHRLVFAAADRAGRFARELQIPFWIEERPFDFRDGMLYFAFTDRFKDGDAKNNAPAADTDGRANYAGGDFAGITQAIETGYFEALGVRTLWISPPFPNPDHWEFGSDGRHYSGYHGYWPTDGRGVQRRFGTIDDARRMVATAHKRGMRVLVDTVLNHVHREHPYFRDHKNDGWFNGDGGCVCGGANCDWDSHRLDCWFTNYLPDVNYDNYAALSAMVDDALFWAREVDVDGFRVDAVKHFPHAVSRRLRARLKELESAGPLYYTVGETFTGGDDGGRKLIQQYVGPEELHAQFDFPLYWNIVDAFAKYSQSLRSLEGAANASDSFFGEAPMSPFFGNHDVERFLSVAAGQISGDPKEQAWRSPPGAPGDDVPYQKLRLALAFLYTQPGVPLLYYGDEYGLPGSGDPDNRRMMKWGGYSPSEQATLEVAKRLGAARRELAALQRGRRYTLWIDDDLYVYARVQEQQVAVVALQRGNGRNQSIPLRVETPIADGTVLKDRLGGASVTVKGGAFQLNLGARAAAVWAP